MSHLSKETEEKLLRLAQILERIPISKSTWWRGIKSGIYPQGFKLSEKVHVWRESEIDAICQRGK